MNMETDDDSVFGLTGLHDIDITIPFFVTEE